MSVVLLALLSLALTVVAPSGTALADHLPPGGSFVDDDGNTHEGYIEAIASEGITRGCGADRYCPADPVSRGEMAAFIRRARNLPAASTDYFDDDDGHLFEQDINALAEAGITRGCRDGTDFCPDRSVNRGEMAAFLQRTDGLPLSDVDHFTDDDDSIFESAIDAIAAAGVTLGCNPPDNTLYCPTATTSRAEMASFLGRFLGLESHRPPDRDPTDVSAEDAIRRWFPDIPDQAIAVARCESGLNPAAVNPNGYHGLFQIGEYYHRDAFERVTEQSWSGAIYSAYYNAQYARHLYDQSDSWRAWSCKP